MCVGAAVCECTLSRMCNVHVYVCVCVCVRVRVRVPVRVRVCVCVRVWVCQFTQNQPLENIPPRKACLTMSVYGLSQALYNDKYGSTSLYFTTSRQ